MPTKKQKECMSKKVPVVIREYKQGKLQTSAGKKVKNPKQAVAIALSVARKQCKMPVYYQSVGIKPKKK